MRRSDLARSADRTDVSLRSRSRQTHAAAVVPITGGTSHPDDQRGKSCFDGEERGAFSGDAKPLVNEKRPTL